MTRGEWINKAENRKHKVQPHKSVFVFLLAFREISFTSMGLKQRVSVLEHSLTRHLKCNKGPKRNNIFL